MRVVEPKVYLVATTGVVSGMAQYVNDIHAEAWLSRMVDREEQPAFADVLTEFGGRLCYRSWEPGMNANVTKVREDSQVYLDNIKSTGHGSVLEHASVSFVCRDVSRVFTHELVRHRAGTAFSQESLRFVRLTDIPFWFPEWFVKDHPGLYQQAVNVVEGLEQFQINMAKVFGLDDKIECNRCGGGGRLETVMTVDRFETCPKCNGEGTIPVPFSEKKAKTSFMRRFAPEGVATSILFTANVRELRHMIEMRTDDAAEEEIRIVFDQVAGLCRAVAPLLFGDYVRDDNGMWNTDYRKV